MRVVLRGAEASIGARSTAQPCAWTEAIQSVAMNAMSQSPFRMPPEAKRASSSGCRSRATRSRASSVWAADSKCIPLRSNRLLEWRIFADGNAKQA